MNENEHYLFNLEIAELRRFTEQTQIKLLKKINAIFLKDYHMRMKRLHDNRKSV